MLADANALHVDIESRKSSLRTVRPCAVCASHEAVFIHAARYASFDDSDLPTETTVVRCRACGTTFADSGATAAAYSAHYARHSKYDSADAASGSGLTTVDAMRLAAQVDRIAPSLRLDATVLDIGAGQGGLLHAFVRRGFTDVTGIDPAPGCVASMRRGGLNAEVGELEDLDWRTDPRRFDLITLSHVLEHVFEARLVLERVASRIADGGRIYIEVPDAARYTLEGFPPFYFLDPEHINHFDLVTLGGLAARCGWRIEQAWQDRIVLDSGARYPIVAVMLVRDAMKASPSPVAEQAVMERYLAECRVASTSSASTALIATWASSKRPLVVWGAGSHAQRLLAQSALGACTIDCIVDGDVGKQGRRLAGLRVVDAATGIARAVMIGAEVAIAIAVGAEDVVARLAADHPELRVHIL